jgi:hypothetical protein
MMTNNMIVIGSNPIAMMYIFGNLGRIIWGRNIQGVFFTVNGKIVQTTQVREKTVKYI